MKRNYKFVDDIYLVHGDHQLDLHNVYEFKWLEYSIADRELLLHWKSPSRAPASDANPRNLTVRFTEVIEFRFMPRDAELPFTEDDCVRTLGYWADEDWVEGIILLGPGEEPEPHWLTAIEFMSGAMIAVRAEAAEAKLTAA